MSRRGLRDSGFYFYLLPFAFCLSSSAWSTTESLRVLLPVPGFADEWQNDGIRLYDSKTVFQYIDGEAELYFPYGFEEVATTAYSYKGDSSHAVIADVYKMGSLLDAFGIYSNYRYPEAEFLKIGAEGFINEYQLMFYQDQYFVRLTAPGEPEQNRADLLACAEAIAKRLPSKTTPPEEITWLISGAQVVPHTEKYIAQSLLGYDFFPRGVEAEATLEGQKVRVFTVICKDVLAASAEVKQILSTYEKYLQDKGGQPTWKEINGEYFKGKVLIAHDPMHKQTILFETDNVLLGVCGLKETPANLDQWIDQATISQGLKSL